MHAAEIARAIQRSHAETGWVALAIDLGCMAIALAALLSIRRLMQHHAQLVESDRLLQEERASELEAFAGRIAHDIRSPLGTISFALSIAGGKVDPERRRDVLERASASIARITKLVDGLLEFARAGGRPTERGRADVDATIVDLMKELTPVAASAGAKEPGPYYRPLLSGLTT